MSFKIIQMRAIAVDFRRNIVSGAMSKIFAESGSADHVAGCIIGFPAGNRLVGREGPLDDSNRRIARRGHSFENLPLALAWAPGPRRRSR